MRHYTFEKNGNIRNKNKPTYELLLICDEDNQISVKQKHISRKPEVIASFDSCT
jgi:hypothetical protein